MNDKRKLHEDDEHDAELEIIEIDEQDDDDDEDERLESDQRDAQDEGEDGSEENTRQLRRKRQKARQKDRIKRAREENAVLLTELSMAKERLEALESRNVQSDAGIAEQRYNYALQQIANAEASLKEAFETGDGDKAIKAQRLREQSVKMAYEAEELKRQLTNPQLQQKVPSLDARTENLAKQWMQENSWFNPAGEDEDSIVARAIDEAWAKEARQKGVAPSSEDYWDELDARVRRRLGPAVDRKRGSSGPPVTGRGEYSPRATTREQVPLSASRIQALKDANLWDDPETRKKYVRKYQEYDKQNSSR